MSALLIRLAMILGTVQTRLGGRSDKGATAVEYGLLVGLIAVAIIVMVGFVGEELVTMFTSVRDGLQDANA